MPDLLELAAIAAYQAFAQSSADRLGEIPPWQAIPPEERADWRAVADAVQMVSAPHIATAERERLYAELGNDHYVIFTEDRWTIEHSVECRLSGHMPECAYHAAIAGAATEYDPGMAGRWRITAISSYGIPPLLEPAP